MAKNKKINNYVETYKSIIGNTTKDNSNHKNNDNMEKAFGEMLLNRATHYRDFEIKASWVRSKYFILFLGALFVAYYTMKKNDLVLQQFILQNGYMIKQIPIQTSMFPKWMFLLITGLGTTISFVWYWVNRGSKMIYENWEHHIDFIEQEYGIGNISRIHCYKYFDKLKPLDIYPISPSKANTLVSLLISISFLILFFYETGILNCVFYLYCKTDCIKCILIFLFFCILFFLPIWIKSKSYPTNDTEKSNKNLYVNDRISKEEYRASYDESKSRYDFIKTKGD